jgi:hypothetical protein
MNECDKNDQIDLFGEKVNKGEKEKEKKELCEYCKGIREHPDWKVLEKICCLFHSYNRALSGNLRDFEKGTINSEELYKRLKKIVDHGFTRSYNKLITYSKKLGEFEWV